MEPGPAGGDGSGARRAEDGGERGGLRVQGAGVLVTSTAGLVGAERGEASLLWATQ